MPELLARLFGSPEASAAFGDRARLQGMLDFDFICKRKTPSVAGIIYTFGGQFVSKMYWGTSETLLPVYQSVDKAMAKHSDVDTIVTVSSTGIATPSLEARVAGRMGFRSDVERVPVFGLGCAGGVSGLAIASRLARARPGSTVLLVAIEICTAAFRMDQLSAANMVATALFGDGAAACVVRSGESGLARIEGAGEHLWPDSLDIMGWKVDPSGLGVIFDRSIPPFAEEHVGLAVDGILARIGVARSSVDRFACHPGGAKVITALETTLRLDQGTLDHERAVLEEYGNMSAPTVLFVLERLVKAGLPRRTVLTALGPGFTCSCLSLASAGLTRAT